jgi:hypothetical protein
MPFLIPLAAAVIPSIASAITDATKTKYSAQQQYNDSGATGYSGPGTVQQDVRANYNSAVDQLGGLGKGYQANLAQAGNIDQGPQGEMRTGQQGLIADLQNQVAGGGPNLAEAQLRQGTNRNLASMLAAMASQHGNQNPGLMRQALLREGGAANQELAGQSAMARMQQQLASQGLLGSTLGQARGQDLGLAGQQASLNQQANLFNAGAQNAAGAFDYNAQADKAARTMDLYRYGQGVDIQNQRDKNAALFAYKTNNNIVDNTDQRNLQSGLVGAASGGAQWLAGQPGSQPAPVPVPSSDTGGFGTGSSAHLDYGQPPGYQHGGIVGANGPQTIRVGERGPNGQTKEEMVVPLTEPEHTTFMKHLMEMHSRLKNLERASRWAGMR